MLNLLLVYHVPSSLVVKLVTKGFLTSLQPSDFELVQVQQKCLKLSLFVYSVRYEKFNEFSGLFGSSLYNEH